MIDLSKTKPGKITGGHMLARALRDKGVDRVFSLCGGFINPIYMGCLDYGIEVVGTRNEMEAGFLATAMARCTRKPSVCIAEPSGFTNYVSAVAEAYYGGDPVIFISASANSNNFDNKSQKKVGVVRIVRHWSNVKVSCLQKLPILVFPKMKIVQGLGWRMSYLFLMQKQLRWWCPFMLLFHSPV